MSSFSDQSSEARAGPLHRLLDRPIPEADLAAGALDAALAAESRSVRSIGVLLFRLGEETLALPAKSLRRITPRTQPSPVPNRAPGVLRGLCNIRGELVLCADLRLLLGLPAREDSAGPSEPESDLRRMVGIGPADAPWVFEVDSLIGIERIDPNALAAPPMTVEHGLGVFVAGLADIEDTRTTILDADRVLAGFRAGLA
jgi:chemotaxis signal transduction protein